MQNTYHGISIIFNKNDIMLLLATIYSISQEICTRFCFAVLCCGYTLTGYPISIRLTSLALWQANDCPSASKATLMNMDKYFMWIHYERLHNHNKAKHNKPVCIFLGIYCTSYHSHTVKTNALKKRVVVLIGKFIFFTISWFLKLVTYILISVAISI